MKYLLPLSDLKDENLFNRYGESPVTRAMESGNLNIFKLFYQHIPHDSHVWKQGLIDVIRGKNFEMLKIIEPYVDFEVESDKMSSNGIPLPLDWALSTEFPMFKFIFDRTKFNFKPANGSCPSLSTWPMSSLHMGHVAHNCKQTADFPVPQM